MTRQKLYRISEVAERYGIHPQTLRLYEREGLLKPSRSRGNARGYSSADLERLECILNLTRELGINLAGVEVILNMREQLSQMRDEVRGLRDLLQEQLLRAGGPPAEAALVPLKSGLMVRASGRGGR